MRVLQGNKVHDSNNEIYFLFTGKSPSVHENQTGSLMGKKKTY